ncbi:MAG: DUF1049 domain-containing protein [Mizugakiibacter sp.]|uniref:DUF1049 domain-containing protein n=1 Tax=Mizugakiibacter sp. TaxID=1972610 RepID=UPI0031C85A4A|nr:DUF1049 domain-containing protein [Xanthomonadaceae bacterium]
MRLAIVLVFLLFAVLGAAFGAVNADSVGYDFLIGRADLPKGAALLAALLLGWLLGGVLAWAGLTVRHRRRVRDLARTPAEAAGAPDARA